MVCKNKRRNQPQQQAKMVEKQEERLEEHLFCAIKACSKVETWLLDSGCTHHMTADSSIFVELNKAYRSRVKVGNGDFVEVKGSGVIAVQTSTGIKHIPDVLYVPEIDQNLISVGQLLEKKHSLMFKENACTILDENGKELMTVQMKDRSFPINWRNVTRQACLAEESKTTLWHKRFGHASHTSLTQMYDFNLVESMPKIIDESCVCDVCQLGKQTRLPFPKNQSRRAVDKLELVHSDVCGPMKVTTLNGSRYFILFIDDLTRMCWVYFLKAKSEVASVFQTFKKMVENESGCKIKTIRTDNGIEYSCRQFDDFCKIDGVKHQLTIPYCPQ
jgi:hypothetical protein